MYSYILSTEAFSGTGGPSPGWTTSFRIPPSPMISFIRGRSCSKGLYDGKKTKWHLANTHFILKHQPLHSYVWHKVGIDLLLKCMCTSRTKNVHSVSVKMFLSQVCFMTVIHDSWPSHNRIVQMSISTLHFVIFCLQGARISHHFISGSPDFMEVFKGFLCCSIILHIWVESLYLTIFKVIICLFGHLELTN